MEWDVGGGLSKKKSGREEWAKGFPLRETGGNSLKKFWNWRHLTERGGS